MDLGSKTLSIEECYVCGSKRIRVHRDLEGFVHLICKECHLMRLHPNHLVACTSLYVDAYFNGQLFRETNGKIGYTDSYSDRARSYRSVQYNQYTSGTMALCHHKQPMRILDVGCGYGAFLKSLMERMGDNVEVYGIELDPVVCAKASSELNGAPVYCVDLKTDKEIVPRLYFDTITMIDVLEHLDDPRAYLQRLAEYVQSQGYLLLSTPNIESFNARIYRDKWVLHSPPYHTYYFGPQSLSILLKQTGWEIAHLYTERTIFHNERHGLETSKGKLFRYLFQHKPIDFLTNRLLKIGSVMTVVACRKI